MIYLITKQKLLYDYPDVRVVDNLKLLFKKFKNVGILGVDTETTGMDPHTKKPLMIQIGNEEYQFVVDLTTISANLLKTFLESRTLIFHNAKFDLKFLYKLGIVPSKVRDTFIQESVLNLGFFTVKKSLEAVARRYLKVSLKKHIRGIIHREGLSYRVVKYAAEDVEYLIPIDIKQRQLLKENDLMLAATLENSFTRVLAYIEYSGMYLNKEKWKAKMNKDNTRLQKATKALDDWIVRNLPEYLEPQLDLFTSERRAGVNWSSSKQVVPVLNKLGINTKVLDKETGKEKDSVEASVLKPHKNKSEIIPLYLEYKQASKVCSVYGQTFLDLINPATNRLHTQFTQLMVTGRLSSGGKDKDNNIEYPNFQNIPNDKVTRGCFTNSKENTILINADYDSQEQRILADMSREPNLLKFYDEGNTDMHSYVARFLYPELSEYSLKEVKKNFPDKRTVAKSAGFAINYGGNGYTIATNLSMTIETGERVYNNYFKAFPELKDFFINCGNHAKEHGYVLFNNITKKKSYIHFFEEYKQLEQELNAPGFWDIYRVNKQNETPLYKNTLKNKVKRAASLRSTIERISVNYRIQGTAADMMKIAAIKFFDYLVKKDLLFVVYISNKVHDEFLIESPKELGEKLSIELKKAMEYAGDVFCKRIKITATPKITKIWNH